jgi:hypothetical protein
MPAASQDRCRQPHHLYAQNRRSREEPRQARERRPRSGAKPSIRVAKSQAIADRLAERVTTDVSDVCRRHHDQGPLRAGEHAAHVRFMDLRAAKGVVGATTDREVIPCQPFRGSERSRADAWTQKRGILAEEDRPVDEGVPHRGLDGP